MKIHLNLIPYITVVTIFLVLKAGHALANNDDLVFLLWPTTEFIELLTSTNSAYLSDSGFYFDKLDVLIDKSCSGGNFWLLCFAMLSFLSLKYLSIPGYKYFAILMALCLSYLFTLGANISRIYATLVLENKIRDILKMDMKWLHEAIGVITSLSFLILIYLLIDKLIQSYCNAKLT